MIETTPTDCEKDLALIHLLEELALNTWPAQITQRMSNWTLRAAKGITKRANSVHAWGAIPAHTRWLEEIEGFYLRLSLPVHFHISPASDPGLVPQLLSNGYKEVTQTMLQTAATSEVLTATQKVSNWSSLTVERLSAPSEEWLDRYMEFEEFPAPRREFMKQLCAAIGPESVHLLARVDGEAAGMATAVTERGWTGLTNVITSERFRRKGVGTAMLQAAAQWSDEKGAEGMYLQVLADNDAALNLYAKAGFTKLYDYFYLVKE
ncbi:GNAT family N-acetyltransferase [Gorillibacterium massiliense]|uniref:GNAT family N-acetyltransferase n=1 Tax=Gorillibacterium massiliense TaxID=1280390 RepID=UPI0004AF533B|nr:GNAT family N-acetyltransferase [Gorillibacterium massiliense]